MYRGAFGPILGYILQSIFLRKARDGNLRRQWLDGIGNSLVVSGDDVAVTMDDVMKVLDTLPSFAPGPDMIPFLIYKRMNGVLAPLFLALAITMLEQTDNDMPPHDFNFAFLLCLLP